MTKQWQRGSCARCGKGGYLYEGTDLAWVHDKLEPPFHQFVLWIGGMGQPVRFTSNYEPDENHVADERNDQVRVDEMPEDAVGYGEDWGRAASW